jgi:hypothetical protein
MPLASYTITVESSAWAIVVGLGFLLLLDGLLLIRERPRAHSTETILFAALALLFGVALLLALGVQTEHIRIRTQ